MFLTEFPRRKELTLVTQPFEIGLSRGYIWSHLDVVSVELWFQSNCGGGGGGGVVVDFIGGLKKI